jgi:hypothetical protein
MHAELAALSAQTDDRNSHFQERAFEREQANTVARQKLPVKLYDSAYGLGRHLLGSALFGVKRGAREQVRVQLPSYRGVSVEYTGPELRQDDATVFLGLVHAVRNGLVHDELEIDPLKFAADLGWRRHTESVAHLRECIERMQSALVRVCVGDSGTRVQLVGFFEWKGLSRWKVSLHPRIVQLFAGGTTFLPRAERSQLTDGLQTWLAGFLRAQSDEVRFDIKDLLKYSGSEAELRRFGEHLRDTMPKLQAVGVVKGFRFGRGSLTVER